MEKELEILKAYIEETKFTLHEEEKKQNPDAGIIDSLDRQLDAMSIYKAELEYRISRN